MSWRSFREPGSGMLPKHRARASWRGISYRRIIRLKSSRRRLRNHVPTSTSHWRRRPPNNWASRRTLTWTIRCPRLWSSSRIQPLIHTYGAVRKKEPHHNLLECRRSSDQPNPGIIVGMIRNTSSLQSAIEWNLLTQQQRGRPTHRLGNQRLESSHPRYSPANKPAGPQCLPNSSSKLPACIPWIQ